MNHCILRIALLICFSSHAILHPMSKHKELDKHLSNLHVISLTAWDHSKRIHKVPWMLHRTCTDCKTYMDQLIQEGVKFRTNNIPEILTMVLSNNDTEKLMNNVATFRQQTFSSYDCSLCKKNNHRYFCFPFSCKHLICLACKESLLSLHGTDEYLSCPKCDAGDMNGHTTQPCALCRNNKADLYNRFKCDHLLCATCWNLALGFKGPLQCPKCDASDNLR